MNPAFDAVLAAGPDAMLSAFDTTALRLGTASQNIEKDFWVCWTLDALFNGLEADDTDPDGQTLLVWYPAATPRSDYVRAAIKIESGAKSALDPNSDVPIKPYVDDDLPALDLTVPAVRTVDPERTFQDKVVILHGLRRWFDKRGELRGGGQRVSRYYYDLHQLAAAPVGATAIAEAALGADCVAHARMFFNRPDYDLVSAVPGTLALAPHDAMVEQLRLDYRAMQGMIFGGPPSFEAVLDSIRSLETPMRILEHRRPLENTPPDVR